MIWPSRARLHAFVTGDHQLPELVAERLSAGELGFRCAAFGSSAFDGASDGASVIDVLLGD